MEDEFHATTAGISVDVSVTYLAEPSQPDQQHFVWAYRVRVTNGTDAPVQLLSRIWRITDAHGQLRQVEGRGVVGKQPVLEPGAYFEYSSGTVLPTASGFMTGLYRMVRRETGAQFDVAIPLFSLDSPHQNQQLH